MSTQWTVSYALKFSHRTVYLHTHVEAGSLAEVADACERARAVMSQLKVEMTVDGAQQGGYALDGSEEAEKRRQADGLALTCQVLSEMFRGPA